MIKIARGRIHSGRSAVHQQEEFSEANAVFPAKDYFGAGEREQGRLSEDCFGGQPTRMGFAHGPLRGRGIPPPQNSGGARRRRQTREWSRGDRGIPPGVGRGAAGEAAMERRWNRGPPLPTGRGRGFPFPPGARLGKATARGLSEQARCFGLAAHPSPLRSSPVQVSRYSQPPRIVFLLHEPRPSVHRVLALCLKCPC